MDNMDTNQGPTPTEPKAKKEGGFGSTLAIIVIILLLIAGGVYYFTVGVDKVSDPTAGEESTMVEDDINALNKQGASDALDDIEADVNATDLSGLDDVAADVNAELQ